MIRRFFNNISILKNVNYNQANAADAKNRAAD